jgi:hypothetical protein
VPINSTIACFAEPTLGRLVGGVADVLVDQKFGYEVVDDGLIPRQHHGAAAGFDRRRNRGVEAGADGVLAVRVPFVMRRPEPRDEQDGEFAQRRRERALEADEVAEPAYPVG